MADKSKLREFILRAGADEETAEQITQLANQHTERRVAEARYDELTKLGRLYNGSKMAYLNHYEERYKYLKGQLNNQTGDDDGSKV